MRQCVYQRVALAGALFLLPCTAWAQASVEVNAGIQFDFVNPGARSLALGGAFTGLADDATSAFTNPAGLRSLPRPEFSIEGRQRNYSTPFTFGGHVFGSPTGVGIDTVGGLLDRDSDSNSFGASFVSGVYPLGKWAIAGYRHELARFETDLDTEGAFYDTGPINVARASPTVGNLDIDIVAYGASASRRITDAFSLGLSVAYYDFSMRSRTTRYALSGASAAAGSFFGPALKNAGNINNEQTQDGDDTAVGVNVGMAWEISRAFRVGAVYRQGPSFDIRVTNTSPSGQVFLDTTGRFNVPDVYGVGVAVRPVSSLQLAIDLNRVRYSSLTEGFVAVFSGAAEDFHVRDGFETHVGAEYGFVKLKNPIFLRGGFWYDPAHSIEFDPLSSRVVAESLLFRPREDTFHFSGGAGVTFRHFEVNGAGDFSERSNTVSVSTVIRF